MFHSLSAKLSKISPAWVALLSIVLVTLFAYGDALRLPLFFDDITHYTWLSNQTVGSIFVSAAGRPYYRPMQFALWKLYETFFHSDSTITYHALNVLIHMLDAWLVVVVMRRLTRRADRWWPAILAGLIFVLFPFSYQVVPLPASFTHPMASLFVLLAILAYERFQITDMRKWLCVALGCGLLAFASNEGSFLLAGLIGLFAFIRSYGVKQWRWIGLFILIAALYYPWYQTRNADQSGALAIRSSETIIQNAVYVTEGLTFPLQPIGQILIDHGVNDQVAVSIIALIALGGLAAVFIRAGQFHKFLFGVGWYTVCLIPEVLLLSHNYLIDAPRVMYLGSIGAAGLLANTAEILWDLQGPVFIRRFVTIVLIGGILIPAYIFIRQRMDLYNLNAAPLLSAIQIDNRSQATDHLLFVNLPAWTSPMRGWYPIGHEGVLFLPAYSSMANFLSVNTGHPSQAKAIEFDNLSVPQPYYYGIYGPSLNWDQLASQVKGASRVYFTDYSPTSINLLDAGKFITNSETSTNLIAQYGDSVALEQTAWSICGDRLQVKLEWHALPDLIGGAHVFVHVLNPDGTLAAQHDSPPVMGLMPFWQWHVGDRVEDNHPIDLSGLSISQSYTIAVGLYDSETGQRLPALTVTGDEPSDNAVRVGSFVLASAPRSCTAN